MGRVAAFVADTALRAGYSVRLVASEVHEPYGGRCEVSHITRPPAGPQLRQDMVWYGRVRAGLRRSPADIVHVHAPALLRVADVMTSHHLSAAAQRHGVRVGVDGLGGAARWAQRAAFIALDELFYRRRPPATRMTFVSEFLREQFNLRYGVAHDGTIVTPPAPPWTPVGEEERSTARRRYEIAGRGLVVGYLGGADQRKGVDAVRELVGVDGVELVIGGPGSAGLSWPGVTNVGYVDVDTFLPACDVVVAPALFDAAPTAVTQAIARGIPVVVRPASGWAHPIARAGAGAVWDGASPLWAAVREAAQASPAACQAVTETFSAARQGDRLLEVYERVLADRRRPR